MRKVLTLYLSDGLFLAFSRCFAKYLSLIHILGYRMLESQAEKGGMQMLENQAGRNMKVMEGQNIRNGIRMMA